MSSDYELAAAYAAGVQPPPQAFASRPPPPPRAERRGLQPMEDEDYEGLVEDVGALPVVDDLEVAALAAAAALEGGSGGEEDASTSDSESESDSGSEEESSSSGGESGDESGSDSDEAAMETERAAAPASEARAPAPQAGQGVAGSAEEQVRLSIQPNGEDAVTVVLTVRGRQPTAAMAAGPRDVVMRDDSEDESSDESVEEIKGPSEIRQVLDSFYDSEEEGAGAGSASAHRAEQELLGGVPVPVVEPEAVGPEDKLSPAGGVQAVLEGMIVVKAGAGARALAEGSLLVLASRAVLGRVEEVFGPVASPLYALRYAGPQPMPDAVAPGAPIFSVDRLSEFVLPEALAQPGYDADLGEDGEAVDPEAQFSDDEAEAEYRRKQKAKRKGGNEDAPVLPQQQKPGGGRGRGRGGGGRGRGRGGRGGGGGRAAPPPAAPAGAQFHPQQQFPGGGRVFRGSPAPPATAFQATATAGQLSGMSLQPAGGPPPPYPYPPPPQPPGYAPALAGGYGAVPQHYVQFGGPPPQQYGGFPQQPQHPPPYAQHGAPPQHQQPQQMYGRPPTQQYGHYSQWPPQR